MNLNYLLEWFVVSSCIVLLFRAIRARRLGWSIVAAGVLAATLAMLAWRPSVAGYVGGGALALLVLIPLFGYRLVLRWMVQQRYTATRRVAACLRILHPADGWRELPSLLRALESRRPEAIAQAAEILSRQGTSRTGIGRIGAALLYRMRNQWAELRDWIRSHLTPDELRRDANLIALLLRAHGEIGDPNALAAAFASLKTATDRQGLALSRNLGRLMLFAFCGRRGSLARLFAGPLRMYPDPVQRFWLATADMAAGHAEAGRQSLLAIRDHCDPLTVAGIERRLAFALPVASRVLTPESAAVLEQAEAELDQDLRYDHHHTPARRVAWATVVLIGLNTTMFGLEIVLGGSTHLPALYRLGALDSSAALGGEWWRAAAALFLHYGALHLAVNMVALVILGPFLEYAVGAARYLGAYLAAGIGSMLVIVALAATGSMEEQIVVGASGGIMGLVGATVAVLLRAWARERAPIAARRLMVLVFVIGFQIVFDLATPEVSSTAHLSGVAIGFIAASLMHHRISRSAPAEPTA